MRARKASTGATNLLKAHEKYRNLSPEDKASYFKSRFVGSALEAELAIQLKACGVSDFRMNVWQSILVNGSQVPREADLKIALEDGRKVVVLCDGEAFHGPRTIFGDPAKRIAEDQLTLRGYFSEGYSAIRYSESEIQSGLALEHLLTVLDRLRRGAKQVGRNWCPLEEWEV